MPTYAKNARFGTVDPAYDGFDYPKVKFDGEVNTSQKRYKYLNIKPRAGERVVLEPVGGSYVITGPLGRSTFPKVTQIWSISTVAMVTPTATTPIIIAQGDMPDPGWPYKLYAIDTVDFTRQFVNNSWIPTVRLDSVTGPKLAISGLGAEVGLALQTFLQPTGFPDDDSPTLTGVHTVYQVMTRTSGVGQLMAVSDGTFGGVLVFQVPVAS